MGKIRIERVDNKDPMIQFLLRDMDKECFPSVGEASPQVDSGVWWIARDGKMPVGYACLRPSKQLSNWGYLSRAGVTAAYRGQGLQKRLIRVRLAYARAMGWEGVVTDTAKDNVASSNSLIASGFRLFRPRVAWSFDSALYWRIYL
jgi:predicted acetyltransferase